MNELAAAQIVGAVIGAVTAVVIFGIIKLLNGSDIDA
jgi:tetrahydromethanopterin S-methyltransferase subunit F